MDITTYQWMELRTRRPAWHGWALRRSKYDAGRYDSCRRVVGCAGHRVRQRHAKTHKRLSDTGVGTVSNAYNGSMRYHGMVIRPPSEANSYILQVTYGCSHNRCTFCGTYMDKPFQVRPIQEVLEDIALAQVAISPTRAASSWRMETPWCWTPSRSSRILDALAVGFPRLRRVGIYANARDILGKTDAELAALRQRKLAIVYLGLESGSDEVLRRVHKGITAAEMVEAVQKLRAGRDAGLGHRAVGAGRNGTLG